MCGILVYTPNALNLTELEYLQQQTRNRGPDFQGKVCLPEIIMEHSVLSLREPLVEQPIKSADNSEILCYNGQIYDINEHDTNYAFKLVRENVTELFKAEGEFAFVYYKNNTIQFARDRLGRRSLLYKQTTNGIAICSVGLPGFVECDAGGCVYKYNMLTKSLEITPPLPSLKVNPTLGELKEHHVEEFYEKLIKAVEKRLVRPPSTPIAIMFSGGIDCTVLTAIIDDLLPPEVPIYLLNIAFENRRTNASFDTPDRKLAKRSFKELQTRSKNKERAKFELVEINIPYEEAVASRDCVMQLIYPNATIMDRDIALAFYFCTKTLTNYPRMPIIFSGLGSDELLAGYSRHASAPTLTELSTELELEMQRIPKRNLGRDDRACSGWAKDLRYPFLDNQIVTLAMNLPLACKITEDSNKIILRHLAFNKLSLFEVSKEKKRAIQFGARSAKMDPGSGRAKGPALA